MYLTRYGTQYGARTVRHGRTIYVAPSAQYSGIVSNISGGGGTTGTFAASDNNDGLSPERAVRTVTYAVNTLALTGDTVILLPGTHTTTAILTPRAGVSILGAGGASDRGPGINPYNTEVILTTSGSNHLFNLAVNNVEVGYMQVRPITAFSTFSFQTAVSATLTTTGNNVTGIYLHDLYFDLVTPAVSLLTAGVDLSKRSALAGENYSTSTATVFAMIENCAFASGGAQGPGIRTATAWVHVKNCRFFNTAGVWASPFAVATNTDNTVIESCIWTTSGTMGSCIDGTQFGVTDAAILDGVNIINCRFPRVAAMVSGLVVDNFITASSAVLTESYQGGTGTVVTAIQ